MKINRLDAHDRFEHFTKQSFDIADCCQDLINQRPFGEHPFYIFAHARTDDDGVTKRLIWQPRLTKPKAQTNSMLFKAYPGSDVIKVIWMIPAREMWDQYTKGKLCENKTVSDSVHDFVNNREKLEANEDDDLSEEKIKAIYEEMHREAKNRMMQHSVKGIKAHEASERNRKRMEERRKKEGDYTKPPISEESSSVSG